MKTSDIETARALLRDYCELCDCVVERMEISFVQTLARISFNLIARKSDGNAWRILLSFEGVTGFRFEYLKNECGSVFTEGFRIGSEGSELLVDFDDDPDNDLSQSDWTLSSSRWLVCASIEIEDIARY